MLKKIEEFIRRALIFVLVIQGISLVVLIGIEVFFRYILQNSLSWPEEVAGISFVWFTLLGVAIGLQEDSHISFDLITKHSPPLLRKIILIFAHLMAIVYAWFMIRYGTAYALMFSFETTPAAQINTLWLNFSLPVSGGFIIIFAVFKIITIMNLTKKEIEEFS